MKPPIEYHGWVALASQNSDWSDAEWDEALQGVSEAISRFKPEDGHSVTFAVEHANAIHTVLLSGQTDDDIEPILELMRFIGLVLPDSYGELVVMNKLRPKLSKAVRYRLEVGTMSQV